MLAIIIILIGTTGVLPLLYFIWMHTAVLKKKDADALIVLGYRCDNGVIHPLLKERLDTAVKLFWEHHYTMIFVSGGAVQWKLSEAEIMRRYLLEQGIPEGRVMVEDQSRNTVHNVVNCRVLMQRYGLQTCLLISNSFHIRRMKYIMKQLDMPASFYAGRDLKSVVFWQWKLTFQEVRAFRLTLPWLERARRTPRQEMMGK